MMMVWEKLQSFISGKYIFGLLVLMTFLMLGGSGIYFGMHQIGGFDHSAMIETTWRLYNGAVSYKDFFNPFPPAFYLPLLWAFELFGPYWHSIIYLNAFFIFCSSILLYILLFNLYRSKIEALILTLIAQSVTTLYIAYYWYSSITTITLLIYILSLVYFVKNSRSGIIVLAFGLSIVSMVKPNMGAIALLSTLPILFLNRQYRMRVIFSVVIAFFAVALFLWINGINFIDLLLTYMQLSGRGLPDYHRLIDFRKRDIVIYSFMFLITTYPILDILYSKFYKKSNEKYSINPSILYIAIASIITGLYGMLTNFEAKQVELPLLVIASYLIVKEKQPHIVKGWLCIIGIIFIAYGFIYGYKRDRVRLIGPFYEKNADILIQNIPFFDGVKSGNEFNSIMLKIQMLLKEHPNEKLFFGPRLELCYAAFGLKSHLNLPIWWHPGTSFAKKDEIQYIQNFLNNDFDRLIFLKNDFTYYSESFKNTINKKYVEEDSKDAHLSIFTKRGSN